MTGSIIYYANNVVPNGFLVCDGSAINRETYSDLFSVIGTTFGFGNNSTTFNIPNMIDRYVKCSTSVGQAGEGTYIRISHDSNNTMAIPKVFSATKWVSNHGQLYASGQVTSRDINVRDYYIEPKYFTLLPCIKY